MQKHQKPMELVKDEEEQLVKNAQRDIREFDALYRRYVQPVYRYLFSRIGSRAEAEDATAQTFLSALEGFARYRHEGHFAAWLFAIARRKSADHFRRSLRTVTLPEDSLVINDDLLQKAIRKDQRESLKGKLDQLPEEDRELLRLRFAAQLGYGEIARLLGSREDAVKKRLYRLLARLQQGMGGTHE